jgi:hypothetical protein
VREYQQALLRRSFRNAEGRPSKETPANLSMPPSEAVETLRKVPAGTTPVDAEEAFDIEQRRGARARRRSARDGITGEVF